MRCAYYCLGEEYNLSKIAEFLSTQGYDVKMCDPEALHLKPSELSGHADEDIYVFNYGCTVLWGLSKEREIEIHHLLSPYLTNKLPEAIIDFCNYEVDSTQDTFIDEESDLISLNSNDAMVKLSLSYALSQSAKLMFFENSVDKTIDTTKHLPEQLMHKGSISLSQKTLSRKMGELFVEKNSVNLHSTILDLPGFFWRRPKYQPFYDMAVDFMDVKPRLEILNKRLNVISELYDILYGHAQYRHSTRLEWIIIYLILFEVLVVIFHELLKWI